MKKFLVVAMLTVVASMALTTTAFARYTHTCTTNSSKGSLNSAYYNQSYC